MNNSSTQPSARDQEEQTAKKSDVEYWAKPVSKLKVSALPEDAINLNVEGRQVVGPLQGFGQLWQKTYRVRLSGADVKPSEVIKTWKENFPNFWPEGNRFYGPLTGISPGEVAVLNLAMPGGMKLSTGVMVLYADEESFTLMTPEGHMFSGWITFSAQEEDNATVAQAQALIRANDPLYEIAFRMGASQQEDRFWEKTLASLAAHFGVDAQPQTHITCVDSRVQWSRVWNIRYNAGIRTTLFLIASPFRWARGLIRR